MHIIYFILDFSSLPAPLNIQPCSWFYISILNNSLRKQLRKISDTVYTKMNQKLCFNSIDIKSY